MVKKLILKIPSSLVNEPILYKMVTLYEIMPTILEAKLDAHSMGLITLELKGTPVNIEMGILYLKELSIEITEL
ncbi:MAG: NIL domain-containing protein [Leptospirales bacterium]